VKPMKFAGIQKTSLIDFPDRVSTVLFTPGCNLRCPFCHNWRLVLEPKGPFLSEEATLQILRSRKKYVDAVAITGGEPTMHPEIPRFLGELNKEGFHVKIDTNGFFPQVLKECMPYVDYISLDVKTTLEKYQLLGAKNVDNYLQTVKMLRQGSVEYEFRTTVVPGFVNEEDIPKIGEVIREAKRFAFQQFVPDETLDKAFKNVKPYSAEKIVHFADTMKKYVEEVILRV